jgi:hypothetical protein
MARISYATRISQRIAFLQKAIDDMQVELNELRVAERVLSRLGTDDEDGMVAQETSKPRSIADTIVDTLRRLGPVDSQTLHEEVSKVRPTTLNTVSSTLSRIKAEGRVELTGKLWSATGDNENASLQLEGGASDSDIEKSSVLDDV